MMRSDGKGLYLEEASASDEIATVTASLTETVAVWLAMTPETYLAYLEARARFHRRPTIHDLGAR